MLHERIHAPGAGTSTDISYKVVKHPASLYGMQYFRMELDCIKFFLRIFICRYRTVSGMCYHLKSRCRLGNIIKMTHPADGRPFCRIRCHSLKKRRRLVHEHFRFSVLTYRCLFYFSTKDMIHQLRTIAQTENRDAKFK